MMLTLLVKLYTQNIKSEMSSLKNGIMNNLNLFFYFFMLMIYFLTYIFLKTNGNRKILVN